MCAGGALAAPCASAQEAAAVDPPATAARATESFACNGELVTAIDIRAQRPPFAGAVHYWRAVARAIGLHHATTRPAVIESFLRVEEGEPCSQARLRESERLLRAQPFLADASVRAVPDSAGGVRVVVETVDEIPALATLRLHGASLAALSLGNQDIGGNGLRAVIGAERGDSYRTPVFGEVEAYALAGEPIDAFARVERERVGGGAEVDVAYPFLSDVQRGAWHLDWTRSDDYFAMLRPADDRLALRVRHWSWEGGAAAQRRLGRASALLGAAISGVQVEPDARGVIIGDSGLAPDTGTTLTRRYAPFRATRAGALLGLQRVRYVTVVGFDALAAPQDVATGFQLASYVARSVGGRGTNDAFVSGAAYAGAAGRHTMLGVLAQLESRRPFDGGGWDGTVGSARAAWYLGGAPGALLVVADELSVGDSPRLPLQLGFADRTGGVRGYERSLLVGGRRNVARAELRWSVPAAIRRADLGFAAFSDVGTLWPGGAPYGMSATRASVGVSLLGAYPTRSKRLYRVDLAIPLDPVAARRRFEIRFSAADRTGRFWQEPADVAEARLGAEPARLFEWPAR